MDVATAVRKIKRQFGDEYNVVINDSDIYDWMHDAELDIIRSTSDNDTKLNVPASNFPLRVPDRVNIKRVSVAGKPLTHTSLTELDLTHDYTNAGGGPIYWFYQSGQINLWPTPVTDDKYTVEVLYSKAPPAMSVVAPYLEWQTANSPIQQGNVANNISWKLMTNFNVVIEMSILASGTNWFFTLGPHDFTTPDKFHWSIGYNLTSTGGMSFYAQISDGVTVKSISGLPTFKTGYVMGTKFKLRIIYDNVIGNLQIFDFNSNNEEILSITSPATGPFNVQTTVDAPLTFGVGSSSSPSFRLYSFELLDNIISTIAGSIFYFNGATDLPILPGIPLTPFSVASGHSMAVTGGIQKGAFNEFTVPEVYHEDIVKFCLARAHNKNQNWRAAEAEMEQYDRHVSTRRNEAQSTDQPQYKISDPDDFQSEYWYV